MELANPQVIASRVRAALAYANIDVKESEAKVGISYATMTRIVSPTHPRTADTDELRMIADACDGVPRWFLEHGFAPPVETGEADLREHFRTLAEGVSLLLGAEGAPKPQGELARRLQAVLPNRPDQQRPDSPAGDDARTDNGRS